MVRGLEDARGHYRSGVVGYGRYKIPEPVGIYARSSYCVLCFSIYAQGISRPQVAQSYDTCTGFNQAFLIFVSL